MKKSSIATRLQLPQTYEARMRAIVARSAATIAALRPQWYRARFHGRHLRIFCGRLIVITLEGNYIWLALDERALGKTANRLRSWCWDESSIRPGNAKGKPYPRYARPDSRNGFYDPAKDPEALEWRILEGAHLAFLQRAAVEGRAPDHRTKTDLGLAEDIATWGPFDALDVIFDLAVHNALQLEPEARRARLERAPRKPSTRTTTQVAYIRNPDVVAEVLFRAGSTCELCKKPAPFPRASDGNPYLEVHHLIRLAE